MWESNPPCVNAADLQSAVHPLHVPPVKMETHHGLAPCNSYLASNRFESLAYTPLIGTAVIWLLGRGIEDTTCVVPDERPIKGVLTAGVSPANLVFTNQWFNSLTLRQQMGWPTGFEPAYLASQTSTLTARRKPTRSIPRDPGESDAARRGKRSSMMGSNHRIPHIKGAPYHWTNRG